MHQPRPLRPLFLTALLLAPLMHAAEAQVPAPPRPIRDAPGASRAAAVGTASITGTVVIAGSGHPARRARVLISGEELRGSRTTISDEQGRFAFTALPAGRYRLNASKTGYLSVSYGQRQPGTGRLGTPIQLSDAQKFEARLQMPRGGVITGTILDENAEASPGTAVRVMRYVVQSGQRRLQQAGGGSTDDRGIYRVFGLQPGDYIVCATPRNNNAMADADRLRAQVESLRRAAENAGRTDAGQAQLLLERAAAMQTQMPADEQQSGYAPVCYPGSTTPSSSGTIALDAGEERGGVDFQLQLVPVGFVEGIVTGPAGTSPQNIQVRLINTGLNVPGLGNNSTRPSPDGRFRFSNVAPGQYTLVARGTVPPQRRPRLENPERRGANQPPARADATRLWAAADVSMDGTNASNVMLVLQPGMTVSGQVEFEGALARPADLTRLRVNLVPITMPETPREMAAGANARVGADGRFTIRNVIPGTYRLTASGAGGGWRLESSIVGGQDTLDFPFDVKPNQNVSNATVTFSDRLTELSGTLLERAGAPATDYTIIIFPADQKYWTPNSRRLATARPATDGRFTIRTLPPGDYQLATIIDPEPGAWTDPEYLRQLESLSMSITLAPGEKKVQNVRLSIQ